MKDLLSSCNKNTLRPLQAASYKENLLKKIISRNPHSFGHEKVTLILHHVAPSTGTAGFHFPVQMVQVQPDIRTSI